MFHISFADNSDNANYPKEKRPLMGVELSEYLADKCNFSQHFPKESKQNLQRVAMCYEIDRGRNELIEEVKKNCVTPDRSEDRSVDMAPSFAEAFFARRREFRLRRMAD
ncbi:MAG TPA: hypothetical protein VGO91_06810 [Pyrinomonadaceae bacterium]|jgi:hypothetical protein|nr:hypothetical protein [Pyrinomonadaceae bacterium]